VHLDNFTFGELRDLADATLLIAAAVEAGIFHALADAPATPDELARRLDYDPRATRMVMLALAELGVLQPNNDRFAPSPRCSEELCDPTSPAYVARGMPHWLHNVQGVTRIGEVLREGGPLDGTEPERTPANIARFMGAMAAAPRERIDRIVEVCLTRRPDARTVLDLGGGPGHMTRVFVERGLRATLYDTTDIIAYVTEAFGLRDIAALSVVAGDFTVDALPPGPFDLVLISNVVHIYGPATIRELFGKVAASVEPGGVLAVAELLRGRSARAASLAIQMLLKTEAGDMYMFDELSGWMAEAGFTDARLDALDDERDLVSAVRA
jgi:SAM-dependent methyltransferase